MEEDPVKDYLSKLDFHKSVGSDGTETWVLTELADVIVRPLYNLCLIVATERSAWRLEKSNCHSYIQEGQEGGPRELQAGQAHLDPWEVMERLILENTSRHMKDDGGTLDVVFLDFSKTFGTVLHKVLRSPFRSSWNMVWMSRQWGWLKPDWTARPRVWWSVAQGLVGGQ